MSKPPAISAIVVSHNYGRFLAHCLDSLLSQSLPFSEILVVDDNSTDETPQICVRYGGRIRFEKVSFFSVARARQYGFERTSGEFVVMVDADDWFEPFFNERLAEALMRDPSAGFAYSGAFLECESGGMEGFPGDGNLVMLPFDARRLHRVNYIVNCAMVRRKAWLGQDPAYVYLQDWEHWLRVVRAGWRGVLVREKLFHYRIHGGNATLRHAAEGSEDTVWRIRARHALFDLTVLMILDERFTRRSLRALSNRLLEEPLFSERTQLLVVNNTGDASLGRSLEILGAEVKPFSHAPYFSWKKGYRPDMAAAEHRSRLLKFARSFVLAPQVLWLDPQRRVSKSLYERLAARLDEEGVAMVSCGPVPDAGCALLKTRTFDQLPLPIGLRKLQAGRFTGVLHAWLISQGRHWATVENRAGRRPAALP